MENNDSINTKIIQGVKIDQQLEDVIVNKELDASLINLIGLYDPAENGLDIDMWSNSDGDEIKSILKKINSQKLSNFSEKILDITLLTNSYLPKNNISAKEFLDLKFEYLIKKNFSEQVLKHYHGPNNPIQSFGKIVFDNKKHSLLNKALFFELKTEIPGAQTWRIDRTGLAHAVELREPFLDYKLVEFSTTIPSHLKINTSNGMKKKYILQKLALELLPKEVIVRKKFPWGIPFYDFFKSEFLSIAESVINKSMILDRPYLNENNSYVTKICNKIKEVGSDLSKNVEIDDKILRQILFLFNLELWYQIFIEGDNVKKPNLSLNRFV